MFIQQGRVATLLHFPLGQAFVERSFPICAEAKVGMCENTHFIAPSHEVMMDGRLQETICVKKIADETYPMVPLVVLSDTFAKNIWLTTP